MAYYQEDEGAPGFFWLLTGVAIGAALGMLYAPKPGSETRADINDYARDMGERSRGLMGRISEKIPARVKAAAGFGAIKEGGREAFREAKNEVRDRLS